VEAEAALILSDGTVQLPASSVAFGLGSSWPLSLWPLSGASTDLKQGGQVLWTAGSSQTCSELLACYPTQQPTSPLMRCRICLEKATLAHNACAALE
jgi:hypothetical protein